MRSPRSSSAGPMLVIESIASAFDRAEARRQREAALYASTPPRPQAPADLADPSTGLT